MRDKGISVLKAGGRKWRAENRRGLFAPAHRPFGPLVSPKDIWT